MKPKHREYAQYRLQRATETLNDARLLLRAGSLASATNRLYYACFYCVSALLLTEGKSSKKHTGIRALFNRQWVHPGRVPASFGEFYHLIFEQRHQADYEDLANLDEETVRRWCERAENFVRHVSALAEQALGTTKETD